MSMQPVGKAVFLDKIFSLKVPAVKGLSAASAAVFKLMLLSHSMPRYLISLM